MLIVRILLAGLLYWWASMAGAQNFVAVPPLTSPVTDQVGMLNPGQRQALENVLREYEARTGSQIAVLLISKTEPEAIEQYSIRVADAWKIGRKGIDDGAILIVAKDNPPALRRLRIEAGRGVQGVLTDAQSKRILQDVIAPHFRQGDFYGGLVAGVSAIANLLNQEQFPAPAGAADAAGEINLFDSLLPFLFFMFIVFMMRSRRGGRRGLSRNGWGLASGVILGNTLGRGGGFGGRSGGGFGGGFGGRGGTFDGGGASGNW